MEIVLRRVAGLGPREFPNGCNQLAKAATYWASFPISNVCLERAFGIMRSMESPLRSSLNPESVREELLIKVNRSLVEGMLAHAVSAQ